MIRAAVIILCVLILFGGGSINALACDPAVHVGSPFVILPAWPQEPRNQTEVSVALHPGAEPSLLIGANLTGNYDPNWESADEGQGAFMSFDGGHVWDYSEIPQAAYLERDPAVAFLPDGTGLYSYIGGPRPGGLGLWNVYISRWDQTLNRWGDPQPVTEVDNHPDKPHMVVDHVSQSYAGRVYLAWTEEIGGNIVCARSENGGENFYAPESITKDIHAPGGRCMGVNLAVAPNGYVYAAWSIIDDLPTGPNAIGFNISANGGVSWGTPQRILEGLDGVENDLLGGKDIFAQTWPVIAVDTTAPGPGIVYLVWDEQRNSEYADIFIIRSDNGGLSWGTPTRVNADYYESLHSDQFFPWVTADRSGGVNVLYYDCRSDYPYNYKTEAWLARSTDGGATFQEQRIGDVSFEPCPCGRLYGDPYMGEYLGMGADADFLYPAWWDNRYSPVTNSTKYKVYTTGVALTVLDRGIDEISGVISQDTVIWSASLEGDATVPQGVTMRVKPWAKIVVDANPSDPVDLTVYGSLIFETGGARPLLTSHDGTAGDWSGITIKDGGSVDWGNGCTIVGADVAVTIEDGATTTDVRGVKVENAATAGIRVFESTRLVADTVIGVLTGHGIASYAPSVQIDSCRVSDCLLGIYTYNSEATVQWNLIEGPGHCGIELRNPSGTLTHTLFEDSITGYFTGPLLRAEPAVQGTVDHCDFIASGDGQYSDTALWLDYQTSVTVRDSRIRDFRLYGVWSNKSESDFGDVLYGTSGNNSIFSNHLNPSGYYIFHLQRPIMLMMEGPGQNLLKAEDNWWGTDTPSASLFSNVDYFPYQTSDPLPKRRIQTSVVANVPDCFNVGQNYPNPFNAGTVFEISLPEPTHVSIEVYNMMGQRVKTLSAEYLPSGAHRISWDGTDNRGRSISSGVYLYRVRTNGTETVRKMVVIR